MASNDQDHSALYGKKDRQTVTPEGERLIKWIDGVKLRTAPTQLDERGEVSEIYNPIWGFHDAPVVYVYQAMLRPGIIKGWVVHQKQDDRLFASLGFLKIVLYDIRESSVTKGHLNEVFLSERNRGLISIPCGVAHAVQNIGTVDALFINLPTVPYNHADPDKFRIAIDSSDIPYSFDRGGGL